MSMTAINALKALYSCYDALTDHFSITCRPGCATCCSVNVTITSLESAYLNNHALLSEAKLTADIAAAQQRPHFIPTLTTNGLARYCLQQQDPPEEKGMHARGCCPLLGDDGLCRIYANRPFACRAMVSTRRCRQGGEAMMPPFLFTINLAFYQLIEHLDQAGISGNMLDMLMEDNNNTLSNCALPGFPVAAEQQKPFNRVLEKIKTWPVNEGCLGDFFPHRIFPH